MCALYMLFKNSTFPINCAVTGSPPTTYYSYICVGLPRRFVSRSKASCLTLGGIAKRILNSTTPCWWVHIYGLSPTWAKALSSDPSSTRLWARRPVGSGTYSKLLGSHLQDIEDHGVVALAGIVAALALQRV